MFNEQIKGLTSNKIINRIAYFTTHFCFSDSGRFLVVTAFFIDFKI